MYKDNKHKAKIYRKAVGSQTLLNVIRQHTHKPSQAEHSKGKAHLQKRNNGND